MNWKVIYIEDFSVPQWSVLILDNHMFLCGLFSYSLVFLDSK